MDLSIESRNKVTALFASIKGDLKKGYSLRSLGLSGRTWHNINLNEFMRLPKEHYLQILNGKPKSKVARMDLVSRIENLYSIFDANNRKKVAG